MKHKVKFKCCNIQGDSNLNCQFYCSLWWNLEHKGKPLALLQGCSTKKWNICGIQTFHNIMDNGQIKTWDNLAVEFNLSIDTARTYNIVFELCKNVTFRHDSDIVLDVANDLMWGDDTPLMDLKSKAIYKMLTNNISIKEHVNMCWNVNFTNNNWKNIFSSIWHNITNPKKACFRWFLLLQKLPFKINQSDVDLCNICRTTESIMHIFFDFLYAKEVWNIFCNELAIWNVNGKLN